MCNGIAKNSVVAVTDLSHLADLFELPKYIFCACYGKTKNNDPFFSFAIGFFSADFSPVNKRIWLQMARLEMDYNVIYLWAYLAKIDIYHRSLFSIFELDVQI